MISQSMAGEQNSLIPISLYITLTLSPEIKDPISSKLPINLSFKLQSIDQMNQINFDIFNNRSQRIIFHRGIEVECPSQKIAG